MARSMVENLSVGINPLTGERLSSTDCCANEVVQEALLTILENCTIESYGAMLERQRREKKEQRTKRYPNQGKPWTKTEDQLLKELYTKRYAIPHIANILKRSPGAIQSRIKRIWGYK